MIYTQFFLNLKLIHFYYIKVIIAQPRGDKFVRELNKTSGVYELDTVLPDGVVQTTKHSVCYIFDDPIFNLKLKYRTVIFKVVACGSLASDREAFMKLPNYLPALAIIGVGITEAGFNEKK